MRGVQGCLEYFHALGARRAALPYQIDGVVYKVNSRADQEALGFVVARAALGDRAQVSGRRGADRGARRSSFRWDAPAC